MNDSQDSQSKNYRKFQIDINDYNIVHQIQSGGFGLVYEVQNKKTKFNYAAKVLNTHSDESQYKKMINREIGIMIRCQHPTIIKFIGYSYIDFNNQKNVTIFMDLAKKGSLAELTNKSQNGLLDDVIDNTTKQIILVGIARGMMILHQHHIIHRDLKPGNILLDNEYHPHITDFGLSKLYQTGRSMIQSQQCGTSMYMAPEIIEGIRYNGKVDVYSFGILMFEVVTDSVPYPLLLNGKMSPYSFNKKIIEEDLRPKFEFPINPSIQKLIESCWAKDPKERPTFEEIYKKLAYNIDDLVDNIYEDFDSGDSDDCDNNYYLDGVDANEVIGYANDIDEIVPTKKIDELDKKTSNDLVEKIIKENEEFKNKIADIQKENDALKKELDKTIQNVNSIMVENENIKSQIISIQKDKDLLQQIVNPLKAENEEIKKQIGEIQREKNVLKNKLDESIQKTVDIQKENEDIKNKINDVQKENEDIKNKLSDIQKEKSKKKHHHKSSKNDDTEPKNPKEDIKKSGTKEDIKPSKKSDDFLQKNQKEVMKTSTKTDDHILQYPKVDIKPCMKLCKKNVYSKETLNINYITVESFNNMTLQAQQNIISEIKNEKLSLYYEKIDNLLKYLISFNLGSYDKYFMIQQESFQEFLIANEKEKQIILFNQTIETLYQRNTYSFFTNLYDYITPFKDVLIEICCPTNNFKNIFKAISEKIGSSHPNIKISIFIPNNMETFIDQIKDPDQNSFDCVKIVKISTSIFFIPDALQKFNSLEQVLLENPSSITSISAAAFRNCKSLKQIDFPSSVKEIGNNSFYGCESLKKIEIPNDVSMIRYSTFEECTSLIEISIPSTVKTIGRLAFKGCKCLKQISVLSVTEIEEETFRGCESLENISIPSAIIIKDSAFFGCNKLSKITFSSSLKSIGKNAFGYCLSLTKLTFPDSLTSFGHDAFKECTKLNRVTLSPIMNIPKDVFPETTKFDYYSDDWELKFGSY